MKKLSFVLRDIVFQCFFLQFLLVYPDHVSYTHLLMKPQTPEMLLEEKQLREQLYAAVMALPEKQAKRIYARYYLGMRVSEIAAAEGVDPSRVRDSIRRGLKQLAKYF